MINIIIHSFYENFNSNNRIFDYTSTDLGEDLLAPWIATKDLGTQRGIKFGTHDQFASSEFISAVLFLDRPKNSDTIAAKLIRLPCVKFLIINENEVIKPDNWDKSYHAFFNKVLTWNDTYITNDRYIKFHLPNNLTTSATFSRSFSDRALSTMIASGKVARHPNELYSKRIAIINWYNINKSQSFDLYGHRWPENGLAIYKGPTTSKLNTLSRYKFCYCLENAKNFNGYITEKIIDCFRAGTVPIYEGAPNIAEFIPTKTFINFNDFESIERIHNHIFNMNEEAWCDYHSNIDQFIHSQDALIFGSIHFSGLLIDHLISEIRSFYDTNNYNSNLSGDLPPSFHSSTPNSKVNGSRAKSPPPLFIMVGDGDELPLYKKAKTVWRSHIANSGIRNVHFVRSTELLSPGTYNLTADEFHCAPPVANIADNSSNYITKGIWSSVDNFKNIYRQICYYRMLLDSVYGPFFVYHTTLTSVVHFRSLFNLIKFLPKTEVYGGAPGRISSEGDYKNLVFMSGANTLLTRDLVEYVVDYFDRMPTPMHLPNDIWLAHILREIPRIALPLYSFVRRANNSSDLFSAQSDLETLINKGYFHFRVKTGGHVSKDNAYSEESMRSRDLYDAMLLSLISSSLLCLDYYSERSAPPTFLKISPLGKPLFDSELCLDYERTADFIWRGSNE